MRKMVLSILVDNTPGALSRVVGLFSRRGYNIDSLTVGETENTEVSRMTVAVTGDGIILDQIEKQITKLENVRDVKELTSDGSVCRELLLVKVSATKEERPGIIAVAGSYRAEVKNTSPDTMMIEMTGSQSKLDAFIELMEEYDIKELVRTGITGLTREVEEA